MVRDCTGVQPLSFLSTADDSSTLLRYLTWLGETTLPESDNETCIGLDVCPLVCGNPGVRADHPSRATPEQNHPGIHSSSRRRRLRRGRDDCFAEPQSQ